MGNIITTLMERDELTREEATEQVKAVKAMLSESIDNGANETDLEEILMDKLDLEPDYLFELL